MYLFLAFNTASFFLNLNIQTMKYLKPGDSVGKICLIPLDVFGVVLKYNKNMIKILN